ncbi:polysaccharide biosynthesis/export family protein [Flammeovirga sp. SubArs3]|uniref:polysaccharide biosynthesis/export family protein n=1 Tax=Flammeovirga sp. SubArs3 TaxID=2995316 RepID=UPI00248C5779|nr:polysaccharide biosynthesis/export family protein [Flammeovirga sp. SubArs3]
MKGNFIQKDTVFYLILLTMTMQLSSCSIRKSILFKTDESINQEAFISAENAALNNYTIEVDDYIAMSVFTNKGEKMVDPNGDFIQPNQLLKQGNTNGNMGNNTMLENPNSVMNSPLRENGDDPTKYLVKSDGTVNFPLVGNVSLKGLTLEQANRKLEELYSKYYQEPYVVTQYTNKRVIVLGATGAEIVPLRSEHMTLLEIIALASQQSATNAANNGIPVQNDIMATNIRMVRPDPVLGFNKPAVQLIDLSTIQGMAKANLNVMPNDVIYIEPRRKSDTRNLQDLTLLVSVVSSVVSLYLLIQQISTPNN